MLIHHGPTLSGKQSAPSTKRERDGKTLALSYIIEAMWNFRVSYCPTLQHKVIFNELTILTVTNGPNKSYKLNSLKH